MVAQQPHTLKVTGSNPVSATIFGELSERFKEPVLKTGDGSNHREFESHTLRQNKFRS